MTQEAICVGIDVAKAGMEVSIRPTDDIWEVSNDEAGIRQLVSHLKLLWNLPSCCWRRREAWNCPL